MNPEGPQYWDGPHSGVMLWNSQKCYFQSYEDVMLELDDPEFDESEYTPEELEDEPSLKYDYPSVRFFKVYQTPINVMNNMIHNHQLFDELIGTHTNYDDSGKRTGFCHLNPNNDNTEIWNNLKNNQIDVDLDLDNWPVVGKFRIGYGP